MSRQTAFTRPRSDRTNLYAENHRQDHRRAGGRPRALSAALGTQAAKAPLGMPKNAATGRRYSGINVLILWGAVIARVLVQIGSTDMRVPDAAYSFQARSTAFQTAGAIRP